MLINQRNFLERWIHTSAQSYYTVMLIPHNHEKGVSFRFSKLLLIFLSLLIFTVLSFSTFAYYQKDHIDTVAKDMEEMEKQNYLILRHFGKNYGEVSEKIESYQKLSNEVALSLGNDQQALLDYRHSHGNLVNSAKLLQILQQNYAFLKYISQIKDDFTHIPGGWPTFGQITSLYGRRIHPVFGHYHFHTGLDIGTHRGTPVFATGDGVVVTAQYMAGYGNAIFIKHQYGYSSVYGHNSTLLVQLGQQVTKGQLIARVGSTGVSTGPHVHYEVRLGNKAINPIAYLSRHF